MLLRLRSAGTADESFRCSCVPGRQIPLGERPRNIANQLLASSVDEVIPNTAPTTAPPHGWPVLRGLGGAASAAPLTSLSNARVFCRACKLAWLIAEFAGQVRSAESVSLGEHRAAVASFGRRLQAELLDSAASVADMMEFKDPAACTWKHDCAGRVLGMRESA